MKKVGWIVLLASVAHAEPASLKLDLFAQQYESSQNLSAGVCVIHDGANIRLLHGIRFVLRCDVLRIEGAATIDGTGDRGENGAPGGDNAVGAWTSTDHCTHNQGHTDWEKAGTSDQDRGGNGSPGKPGGAGATVLISYGTLAGSHPIADLHISVPGGAGGAGGAGGQGRLQICGCHPEHRKHAGAGAAGSDGLRGHEGSSSVTQITR